MVIVHHMFIICRDRWLCQSVCVRRTAFSDGIAGVLVAGFVFQVLGGCDLFLQEGASLFQLLQRNLKTHNKCKLLPS